MHPSECVHILVIPADACATWHREETFKPIKSGRCGDVVEKNFFFDTEKNFISELNDNRKSKMLKAHRYTRSEKNPKIDGSKQNQDNVKWECANTKRSTLVQRKQQIKY